MYKLIATDMDGTLLNSNNMISEQNALEIILAQQKNVKFALASGRPLEAMQEYAKYLRMKEFGGYIISYNGAQIVDCKSGETIFANPLNKEQIDYIFKMSKKYGVTLITYIDGKIYTSALDEYCEIESTYTKMSVIQFNDTNDLKDAKILKFMFVYDPERIKEIYEDFKETCKEMHLSVAISDPHFLEIIDIDSNKGVALNKVCELLSIDKKDVIACGDSLNDIPMLEIAGLAVAAKNAKEEVKKICSYVSVNNDENILKDVIQKYI